MQHRQIEGKTSRHWHFDNSRNTVLSVNTVRTIPAFEACKGQQANQGRLAMDEHAAVISRAPALAGAVRLLASAGLPASDLTEEHMDAFFYDGHAAAPDAMIGIEIFGPDALLRSLVVSPALRNRGLGRLLVATAEQYARERGVNTIYLLTTTAEQFFRVRGYSLAAREAAPPAIRSTAEFAGLCPASSAFLLKHL
jgi:amino-acid N-acetyltransferase